MGLVYLNHMSSRTLYDKVWDLHRVAKLDSGQDQIFIGLHLIHEVTTPQAFSTLRSRGAGVAYPNRTFGTLDHIIPTDHQSRPFKDRQAELMTEALEKNTKEYGIRFFDSASGKQGIVHVIGPELGLTQPGMTIVCGDSHTSTHGAFGALAFGIGTTQVEMVLETQTLPLERLKVRRIRVEGQLAAGVTAKDVILKIIHVCGVKGGIGYAYEYAGDAIHRMSMEERLTICNMSIEGGARIGYVNPDEITSNYLKGKEYAPKQADWDTALSYWKSIRSDEDAVYDDDVLIRAEDILPMVTWGIHPAQSVDVTQTLPLLKEVPEEDRSVADQAYAYMKFKPGMSIQGIPIDVAFIGSCTNSRLSDLRLAAQVMVGKKVNPKVKTLVVPGSQQVQLAAEAEGLDKIFIAAGAEWREPGCSMCLAMNPDRLIGDQVCASTSNRNFMGRQGSPTGRTLLMSPSMVAAAAIAGHVVDVRSIL